MPQIGILLEQELKPTVARTFKILVPEPAPSQSARLPLFVSSFISPLSRQFRSMYIRNFALEEERRIVSDFRIYIIGALRARRSTVELGPSHTYSYTRAYRRAKGEFSHVPNFVVSRFPAKFASATSSFTVFEMMARQRNAGLIGYL